MQTVGHLEGGLGCKQMLTVLRWVDFTDSSNEESGWEEEERPCKMEVLKQPREGGFRARSGAGGKDHLSGH